LASNPIKISNLWRHEQAQAWGKPPKGAVNQLVSGTQRRATRSKGGRQKKKSPTSPFPEGGGKRPRALTGGGKKPCISKSSKKKRKRGEKISGGERTPVAREAGRMEEMGNPIVHQSNWRLIAYHAPPREVTKKKLNHGPARFRVGGRSPTRLRGRSQTTIP